MIEKIKKEIDSIPYYDNSNIKIVDEDNLFEILDKYKDQDKYKNAWEELSNMLKSGYPPIYFTMQELEKKHGIEVE